MAKSKIAAKTNTESKSTSASKKAPAGLPRQAKTDTKSLAQFPKTFVLGTASSCFQIEGAASEDGRGESIWDRFCHTTDKTQGANGDVACDHYHRMPQDVQLLKNLGVAAYRFSISWPRVVPDGDGAVNTKGLDFYSRLVDTLAAAKITPYVTLYMWDLPQSLEDRFGGWRSRKTSEAYSRYAEAVVRRLGDRVKNWMTLNEMPATIVAGYGLGVHAPGAKEPRGVLNQIQHCCLLAHGYGVQAVRNSGGRRAEVGTAHNARVFVPVYETPENVQAAAKAFVHYNSPMLEPMTTGHYPAKWLDAMRADAPQVQPGDMELISSPVDFIGLNVYRGTFVRTPERAGQAAGSDFKGVENVAIPIATATPNLAVTPTPADGFLEIPFPPNYPSAGGWVRIVPDAIYWGIRHLHELYGYRKLYVTENGCAQQDLVTGGEILDIDRIQYFREYLRSAQRLVADGYPLNGYFAWSFMDSFEWGQGYSHRYGLHYVNRETLSRTPKLSAAYYAACIKARRPL